MPAAKFGGGGADAPPGGGGAGNPAPAGAGNPPPAPGGDGNPAGGAGAAEFGGGGIEPAFGLGTDLLLEGPRGVLPPEVDPDGFFVDLEPVLEDLEPFDLPSFLDFLGFRVRPVGAPATKISGRGAGAKATA